MRAVSAGDKGLICWDAQLAHTWEHMPQPHPGELRQPPLPPALSKQGWEGRDTVHAGSPACGTQPPWMLAHGVQFSACWESGHGTWPSACWEFCGPGDWAHGVGWQVWGWGELLAGGPKKHNPFCWARDLCVQEARWDGA